MELSNTPAKPSKRAVGRPKGARDRKPRKTPVMPPYKWYLYLAGRTYKFQEEVSGWRRWLVTTLLGGVWRKP